MNATALCLLLLNQSLKSPDLPSDVKQLLIDVTPNFEENLRRAFRNKAVMFQRGNWNSAHSLDDVLFSIGDTKIELKNLKFPWIQDFRLGELSPNLPMSCIDLSLHLGHLKIEGEYEANNTTLRKWLPVSHIGRITIGFNNVKAVGKVGFFLNQDSFVAQNYDIKFEPSDVKIAVSYHADAENTIENEVLNPTIEGTIATTVWNQLTGVLSSLLHQQLGDIIVEFSVQELLVDRDEEFRRYAKEQESRANKLLDAVLCSAKDYLVAKKMRTLRTPAFDVIYKGKISSVQQGIFKSGDGFLQDLATLTRLQSFSLYEDKERLTIYGNINLFEFKHGYENYETEYEGTSITGGIKAEGFKNKIFVKITIKKEGERCVTILDSLHFELIRGIDVDITGLASLTWLNPKIKSWVMGHLRQNTLAVIEMYVKEAFLHAISSTDIVAQLVD